MDDSERMIIASFNSLRSYSFTHFKTYKIPSCLGSRKKLALTLYESYYINRVRSIPEPLQSLSYGLEFLYGLRQVYRAWYLQDQQRC